MWPSFFKSVNAWLWLMLQGYGLVRRINLGLCLNTACLQQTKRSQGRHLLDLTTRYFLKCYCIITLFIFILSAAFPHLFASSSTKSTHWQNWVTWFFKRCCNATQAGLVFWVWGFRQTGSRLYMSYGTSLLFRWNSCWFLELVSKKHKHTVFSKVVFRF